MAYSYKLATYSSYSSDWYESWSAIYYEDKAKFSSACAVWSAARAYCFNFSANSIPSSAIYSVSSAMIAASLAASINAS